MRNINAQSSPQLLFETFHLDSIETVQLNQGVVVFRINSVRDKLKGIQVGFGIKNWANWKVTIRNELGTSSQLCVKAFPGHYCPFASVTETNGLSFNCIANLFPHKQSLVKLRNEESLNVL